MFRVKRSVVVGICDNSLWISCVTADFCKEVSRVIYGVSVDSYVDTEGFYFLRVESCDAFSALRLMNKRYRLIWDGEVDD